MDSHITDFVPDPDTTTRCEASGMTRYLCQATDTCDCFEPPACTCTRATSGHIVSLDPTCPARDADPTPEPEPLCECGHGRDEHPYGRCLHYIPIELTGCPCIAYRPATEPSTNTGKPSITTRDTNAYPTGLVERVAEAVRVTGPTVNDTAKRAALAVATWLDEQIGLDQWSSQAIRREVEGAGSS